MIFSSISNDEYKNYPKAIQTAVEYLKSNDFAAMETGVYEIQGKEIYAQVFDTMTGSKEEKRPESHEKYLDVQFLVSGRECIGVTANTGEYKVEEKIDERDLIFYESVKNETFVEMYPGNFCVFFPSDVHRPAVEAEQAMEIRKVVVKVKISEL